MSDIKSLLGPTRLPFLILTPACVVLGWGTAYDSGAHINGVHFFLALIGAVSAHVSVNAFNEYFDFKSGLDFNTQKTPFSGGSGTLPAKPQLLRKTLIMAWASFAVTGLIGLFFLYLKGPALLPLGIIGLFLIYAYTPWMAYHPFLCLIAPGLGFGPAMVMGTHFVLTGRYSLTSFLASLIPFFLVSDLLLLNQFPDVEPDRNIGRRHYPILIGNRTSSIIYASFLFLAYLVIVIAVILKKFPVSTLWGLLTLIAAVPLCIGAFRNAENMEKLLPFMGLNVLVNIATPLLMTFGFVI